MSKEEKKEERHAEGIQNGYEEHYREHISGLLTEVVIKLDPFFRERHEIQEKIQKLQKQANDFAADIQANLDKKAELELKGVDLLASGKKPNFSKQLHDIELSLAELKKWRDKSQDKIKSLNDDLNTLEEKISDEWRRLLNPTRTVLNVELAHLILQAEIIRETWYEQITKFENQENIIRKGSPPKVFLPFTKMRYEMHAAPKNAVWVIQKGLER